MLSGMPLREFCEWYVYLYELKHPPNERPLSKSITAQSAEEEIAFLKANFSNTAVS